MEKLIRIPRDIYFSCCEALFACGFGQCYDDWDNLLVVDIRLENINVYHLGVYANEDGLRVLQEAGKIHGERFPDGGWRVFAVPGEVDVWTPEIPLPVIIPNPQT